MPDVVVPSASKVSLVADIENMYGTKEIREKEEQGNYNDNDADENNISKEE